MENLFTIELVESNDTMYYTEDREDAFAEYKREYNNENYEVCEYIVQGEVKEPDILENCKLIMRYNRELIEYLTND